MEELTSKKSDYKISNNIIIFLRYQYICRLKAEPNSIDTKVTRLLTKEPHLEIIISIFKCFLVHFCNKQQIRDMSIYKDGSKCHDDLIMLFQFP